MKISTFSFVPLGKVPGPHSGSFREREESIHRILVAHKTLIEARHDIISLSDIYWEQGESGNFPFFMVERGPYYDPVRDATSKGLTWCTDNNDIDYEATIAQWKSLMQTVLSQPLIDVIESNDLSLPQFQEFKVMYTLYLVSATRSGGNLIRHPDFAID